MRVKYSTIAVLAVVMMAVSDIVYRFGIFAGASNRSTLAVLSLNCLVIGALLVLLRRRTWLENMPRSARYVWSALLCWGLVSLIRGSYVAEDYWAWKELGTNHLFACLAPLAIVIGLEAKLFRRIPAAALWILFPASLLLLPLSFSFDSEITARVAMPVWLMLLLVPFLSRRLWIPVVAVSAVSLAVDPSYRANLLRILPALGILLLFFSRVGLKRRALNTMAVVFFATPLLLLYLGVSGKFNVFRDSVGPSELVTVVEGGAVRRSALSADTRTFLYSEVFSSMERRGSSLLVGQGAGTGYESSYFSRSILATGGRGGSEVGFLNTLLYSGVVGVLLYAACLFFASYVAINHSRNDLCRMLGVYLAFRWVLFFIEDIPRLDMNMLLIWISVGLCLSKEFRSLTNSEVIFSFARRERGRVDQ